jgi:hypothetical protein
MGERPRDTSGGHFHSGEGEHVLNKPAHRELVVVQIMRRLVPGARIGVLADQRQQSESVRCGRDKVLGLAVEGVKGLAGRIVAVTNGPEHRIVGVTVFDVSPVLAGFAEGGSRHIEFGDDRLPSSTKARSWASAPARAGSDIAGSAAAPARRARRFMSVDEFSRLVDAPRAGGVPLSFLLGVVAVIRAVLEPVRVASPRPAFGASVGGAYVAPIG